VKFDDIAFIQLVHQVLTSLPLLLKVVVLAAVAFASSELTALTVKQLRSRSVKAAAVAAIDLFAFASGMSLGDMAFALLCGVSVHVGLVVIVEIRGIAFRVASKRTVLAKERAGHR
jgi:hypothetical protein